MRRDIFTLLRDPAGWLPMLLSILALGLVVGFVALNGVVHQEDEGTPARIFQVLILVDAILIGVFALRRLPGSPRSAMAIVALQVLLAAIPLATVKLLEM
jgi:uncharacterized membrane protein SirB2